MIVASTQSEPDDFSAREAIDRYLMKPVAVDQLDRILADTFATFQR